ncbi:hypothetical protein QEN19_000610 [Hanseniaspora menglaensis]
MFAGESDSNTRNVVVSVLFCLSETATFNNYLSSAFVMGDRLMSLKSSSSSTNFDSIIIIDLKTYKRLTRIHKYEELVKRFNKVVISQENESYLLKLDAWKIIKNYDKLLYLDLDCWLVSANSLNLAFEAIRNESKAKIFACNETTWPDMFNSGVFGIKKTTASSYSELKEQYRYFSLLKVTESEEVGIYDNFDQGFLNFCFSDTWERLSYVFNVQLRGGVHSITSSFDSAAYFAPVTYFFSRIKKPPINPSNNFNPLTNPHSHNPDSDSQSTYFNASAPGTKSANISTIKFLNKALVFQFIDKPWETSTLEHVAPQFYADFHARISEASVEEPEPTGIATLAISNSNERDELAAEKKKSLFKFPWSTYVDFPKNNTRSWQGNKISTVKKK